MISSTLIGKIILLQELFAENNQGSHHCPHQPTRPISPTSPKFKQSPFSIRKGTMNAIKNEIAQRLEIIPDDKLREVLSFLNYLIWQTENPRTQEDRW